MVPVGLDVLVAKVMSTVAMQIFWFPVKFGFSLPKKKNQFQLKKDTSRIRFLGYSEHGHNQYVNT